MSRRLSREESIALFWSQVDKTSSPTGCWLWTGRIYPSGYGGFSVRGINKNTRDVRVHRFAYILEHGAIPEGLMVLHRPPCITKTCVRHLYAGTAKQNTQDMFTTGSYRGWQRPPDEHPRGDAHWSRRDPSRVTRGEKHGMAKVTTAIVLAIRQQRAAGRAVAALAQDYGLSKTHVEDIAKKKSWKHIEDAPHAPHLDQ